MARLAVSYQKEPETNDASRKRRVASRHALLVDLSRQQFFYSILGLLISAVCIVGGILLFIRGVTGATSWIANIVGAESKLTDAAPGAVLFAVGLLLAFTTRYSIKIKE